MKKILFLGILIITLGCNLKSAAQNETSISFKTTFIGDIYPLTSKTGYSYLLINAYLINNTTETFEFVAYNCTTAANLVTEPTSVKPLTYKCSRNYMVPITLKSKQKLSMPIIFECPDSLRKMGSRLKIGFILVNPKEIKLLDDFYSILYENRKKNTNIVWSTPLRLDVGNGEAFEIGDFCDSIAN